MLTCPARRSAALASRTEGWAAGLQLAGLSLRGRRIRPGSWQPLRRKPPLRAGLPDRGGAGRGSPSRCAGSCWRHRCWTGCLARCATLSPAGSIARRCWSRWSRPRVLVPLDEVRGWWRYHHLFADLLCARLQAERPGRVPALHRNAAAWHVENGLADDAVRHALGAGDATWAARLIYGIPMSSSTCGAKSRRSSGGLPHSRPRWSARGRGCCWPRRSWFSPAVWRRSRACSMPQAVRSRMLTRSTSSLPWAGTRACWRTSPRR